MQPTDSDLLNTLPFLEAAVDSMNHDDDDDDEEEEEQDEDGADEFVEDHHEAEGLSHTLRTMRFRFFGGQH